MQNFVSFNNQTKKHKSKKLINAIPSSIINIHQSTQMTKSHPHQSTNINTKDEIHGNDTSSS